MFSPVPMWLSFFLILFPSIHCQTLPLFISNEDFIRMEKEHFRKIMEKLNDTEDPLELWLRMMDSSTKIPSGFLNGNGFDLGNFDECYNIQSGDIYGKYCLGTIALDLSTKLGTNITFTRRTILSRPSPQPRLPGLEGYTGFHWAACVPSNMKAEEISYLFQTYSEDFCYSKATEPELSTGAIITIVVLVIFLLIITASTTFDIYLCYAEKESPHELLISFSYLSNGRKLFTSTTNPDQLLCLNGIRAISMMWVIIGHEYENAGTYGPVTNFLDLEEWKNNAANMYIRGSSVSVDSFFLVGGLVTVYSFLRATDKGVKFNLPLFYIHRYLRLTPSVAIMVLVHTFILPYIGNGPLWKIVDIVLIQTCKDAWWPTLLYISNYLSLGYCDPPTWYLNVDMQLFILSPLVLIPLTKWPKYGLYALWILAFGGVLVPFIATYVQEIYLTMPDHATYMNDYYYQTYTRFGPYVIGMIYGYFIYKIKKSNQKLNLSPMIVAVLWLIVLTGLVACVYGGHDLDAAKTYDKWGNSLFMAFDSPAWGVGVGGVILLCVTGYGGPINAFLSLPVFQFITKLSYSMYLIHYGLTIVRYTVMRNPFMFSDINIMHNFWGDFTITLVLSMILTLSFESPVIILEKYLFGKGTSISQAKKKAEV